MFLSTVFIIGAQALAGVQMRAAPRLTHDFGEAREQRMRNWHDHSAERDGFAGDLVAVMTLEEKLGQLDLLHPASDPAIEDAVASGLVGGVAGHGVDAARLQSLATMRSRLGIPLLIFPTSRPVHWSPWALAASWDEELCRLAGAWTAQQTRHAHGSAVMAPLVAASDRGDGVSAHIASCDAQLLAQLSTAFLAGTSDHDDSGEQVLAVPRWVEGSPADRRAWLGHLEAGHFPALEALPGELRLGGTLFRGVLLKQCRRLRGIVADRFAQTSCRSQREAAERAVDDGALSIRELDDAVRGLLAVKHGLDLFRAPDRVVRSGESDQRDALVRAFPRSFVLLRNEAGLLPLSPVTDRILVVGADEGPAHVCAEALARSGIGHSRAPGLALRHSRASWAESAPGDAVAISLTRDAARRTDFVFVVLDERHFAASADSAWPRPTEPTQQLMQALATTEARRVAILNTPWPVDLAAIDGTFAAVLQCWTQPADMLEEALADLLCGREAPRGRMPVSVGQYPFGHGLGYSETLLSKLQIKREGAMWTAALRVRNLGHSPVREVIQLYGSRDGAPIRLIDFRTISLTPGEDAPVCFTFPLEGNGWEIGVGKSMARTSLTPIATVSHRLEDNTVRTAQG